jgi:hypothetical protein
MAITLDGTNGINSSGVIVAPDGSASAPAITNDGDTNTGIFFPAADTIAFAEGGAEAMRIDSSGRVGIGLTPGSGQGALQVTSASQTWFKFYDSTAGWNFGTFYKADGTTALAYLGGGGGSAIAGGTVDDFVVRAEGSLLFAAGGGTERARIDSSGTLLVGTTTNIGGIVGAGQFKNVNAGAAGIVVGNSGGTSATNAILFVNSNGIVGGISTSGSSTFYVTSSDYRLKENVVEITDGIDRVKLLNPSRFNFIADSDRTVDGFLAHEVQEVVPEAIAGAKDATKEEEYEVTPAVLDDDGNVVTEAVMGTRTVPDYQGIDQSKLVPLLTAALQEAITKIEALEARVTALENA